MLEVLGPSIACVFDVDGQCWQNRNDSDTGVAVDGSERHRNKSQQIPF